VEQYFIPKSATFRGKHYVLKEKKEKKEKSKMIQPGFEPGSGAECSMASAHDTPTLLNRSILRPEFGRIIFNVHHYWAITSRVR
jgi:hypothetical protein